MLGVPVPWLRPPEPAIVGGAFIPPAQRGRRQATHRTRLHRLPPGQSITDCTIDPDGRFALFSDGAAVFRVFLDGQSDPLLVRGTDSLPIGSSRLNDISFSHHRTMGRLVRLRASPVDYRGLLVDADNDGVYENLLKFDAETIKELPAGWMLQGSY